MSKNPIIVFEGIEGSGKSLHINNVANYLKKINRKFIRIREPGGSKNSEKIRKLILDNKSSFNVNTDLLLYMSARSENINLIKKNYKKKIILIDRFVDSTIAYQHYGFGVDIKIINLINKFLLKNIKVTFTFLSAMRILYFSALPNYFFNCFTALGRNIFRRAHVLQSFESCPDNVYRISGAIAFSKHIMNSCQFQNSSHGTSGNNTSTF